MCLPLGPRLIFQIQFEVDVLIGIHLSRKHRPAPPRAPLGAARGAQLQPGPLSSVRECVCACVYVCVCVCVCVIIISCSFINAFKANIL